MAIDNLIIGTGISGLSIAYWLKEKGEEFILIEAPELVPASRLNAGLLTVGSLNFYLQNKKVHGAATANAILQFCQDNHDLLAAEGILKKIKSYKKTGSLSITSSKTNDAPPSFTLSHSSFHLAENESCWMYPNDGSLDPVELNNFLRALFQDSIQKATVEKLDLEKSLIQSSNKSFDYKRLFLCSNAWTQHLLETDLISPVRAQAFKSQPLISPPASNIYFSDQKVYTRSTPQNELIVGGLRQLDPEAESTLNPMTNPNIQDGLLEFARNRISSEIESIESWAGIMAFTTTHLPIVINKDNLFAPAGYSGHGMGMAFHMAKCLVNFALENQSLPTWISTPNNI